MKEKNQIRILCAKCGCYYYWDIVFEFKDYATAVNQTPVNADVHCPECGSQDIAEHAHHSACFFNCAMTSAIKPPRYMNGPGCSSEPIQVGRTF